MVLAELRPPKATLRRRSDTSDQRREANREPGIIEGLCAYWIAARSGLEYSSEQDEVIHEMKRSSNVMWGALKKQ